MDAQLCLRQQRNRVRRIAKNGAEQIAHQMRRRQLVPAVGIRCFLEQRIGGKRLPLVKRGANDVQALLMTRQIRGKIAERPLQEEPNRQTGRIRRQPQNVEGRTGIQRNTLPLKTLPKADGFHDAVQRILRHVFVCPQQSGKAVAVSGLRRFRPVNEGGRSQQTVIILLAQHVIERFTVGKGSVISDRGVQALPLIPPIGFKSEGIEGNQRCARGLCADNALDAWMQHGNGVLVACNQTATLYRIALAAGNARLPRCTNFRHFVRWCGFA